MVSHACKYVNKINSKVVHERVFLKDKEGHGHKDLETSDRNGKTICWQCLCL